MNNQPASQRTITRPWTRSALGLLALVLGPLLLLASCGDTVGEGTSASDGSTSADEGPDRIVSLSPTATETLWAIGAAKQVVAVDDESNYPSDVPRTKLSAFKPNVEAILGYEPDLVITSNGDKALLSGLEAAGVETVVQTGAATLDDAYEEIEEIGAATGNVAEAAELVSQMQADIEQAVQDAPDAGGLTYFHELDPTLFTTTSRTFIGEVYGLFGLRSIADDASGSGEYPQLSAEYVVDADPDLIMLADAECCGVTPEKVAERPGWEEITAVRDGQVLELDADVASRWGPRIVELVEVVGNAVADAGQPAGAAG